MKKGDLKASNMSYILIGACVVMVLIIVIGTVFAASLLQKKAVEATHATINADISDSDSTRVLQLEKYLQDNAGVVNDTAQIAGSIGQYQQNTIIATISQYARTAGVNITGFNFGTGASAGAVTAAAGETTMTLSSPVSYRNFIVFLNLLENGVMPVTVTDAVISPDSANPSNISVSDIKIKVAN